MNVYDGSVTGLTKAIVSRIDKLEIEAIPLLKGELDGATIAARALFAQNERRMDRLAESIGEHSDSIGKLTGELIEARAEIAKLRAPAELMGDDERWSQMHRERVRLQTQIDHLAERVEKLETQMKIVGTPIPNVVTWSGTGNTPNPPPTPAPDEADDGPYDRSGDAYGEHLERVALGIERPAPDKAAKWEMVAEAIEESLFDVDEFIGASSDTARAAVIKAIELGLAAPADRAACEVTDDLVSMIARRSGISEARVESILGDAAAYWTRAGADTPGEE